jgi:DNA-binding NtrC family response regulator
LEDVPLLVKHFVKKIGNELGLSTEPIVMDEAMHRLQTAQWRGNVRQLENTLYSATLRSRPSHVINEAVLLEDASMWMSGEGGEQENPLDALSKQAFIQILTEHRWDTAKVAKVLKVSRGTIYYKMKKYSIEAPRSSTRGSH